MPEVDASRGETAAGDDPLVLYLVVNMGLGMSTGKIAAQVGHGVQYVLQGVMGLMPAEPGLLAQWARVHEWAQGDSRKVVLRANAREWAALKTFDLAAVVKDAGLTEIPPGSETVLAFWPMRKSERPALLKRLRVLT